MTLEDHHLHSSTLHALMTQTPNKTKRGRLRRRSRKDRKLSVLFQTTTITSTLAACVAATLCYSYSSTASVEAFAFSSVLLKKQMTAAMTTTINGVSWNHGRLPLHLLRNDNDSDYDQNPFLRWTSRKLWHRAGSMTGTCKRQSSWMRLEAVTEPNVLLWGGEAATTKMKRTTKVKMTQQQREQREQQQQRENEQVSRMKQGRKGTMTQEKEEKVSSTLPVSVDPGSSFSLVSQEPNLDHHRRHDDDDDVDDDDDDEDNEDNRNLHNLYQLESTYSLNSSSDTPSSPSQPSNPHPSVESNSDSSLAQTSVSSAYFHSSTSRTTNKPTSSKRSSTMPGFINNKSSQRHQSFRDGLLIAKQANRQDVANKIQKVLTSEAQVQKRKKVNSDAMYSGSASVPDSFIAFASEIHKESRITPKEELELGTKVQEAIRVQGIREELKMKLRREPTHAEWCAAAGQDDIDALQRVLNQGWEAKERLVTSNLRMVQGVVNLYIRNGLGSQYNAGDLMQEGVMALIRAAEKFEPSRGFRFSTYAMYWIRAAVKRSQIIQSRVINVPQRLHETHKKITRTEYELKKELGRKPRKSELAGAVGITEMQLDRCLAAIAQQCLSLDAELENTTNPNKSNTNKDTLYNILAAKYDNVEYKQLQSDLLKDDLIDTLRRHLSPREVDLLLLRYGLMDEKTLQFGFSGPLTIAEVSRLVGLKPDKVRRIINKSLRQLRHLIAHEWQDFEKELS